MTTLEAEQLYREALEYAEGSGRSYAESLRAVLEEKSIQPRNTRTAVLEASTKLDVEIHRLMTEEHFSDYCEGMHHVLSSTDPRHVAIARAYVVT